MRAAERDVNERAPTATELSAQTQAWFDSPLGRSLQAVEAHRLREVLAPLYGKIALQLGRIGQFDLLDASSAPSRLLLDPLVVPETHPPTEPETALVVPHACQVCGTPDALPFDDRSIDVALLPHTLDFAVEPHQVLREVSRVLVPEGHVVILGFNWLSLWGLRRALTARPRPMPWRGNFFSLVRVKDWLSLLDFECTSGGMLYYRPPFARENLMERFAFLEQAGDRWWPLMAAVYLVVAKKRVFGMTPLPLAWKTKAALGGTTVPAVRSALRQQTRARPYG